MVYLLKLRLFNIFLFFLILFSFQFIFFSHAKLTDKADISMLNSEIEFLEGKKLPAVNILEQRAEN